MATNFFVNERIESNATAEPAAVGTVDNLPFHVVAMETIDHNLANGTGLQVEGIQYYVSNTELVEGSSGDDGAGGPGPLSSALTRFHWGAEGDTDGSTKKKLKLRNAALNSTEMETRYEVALSQFIQSVSSSSDPLQSNVIGPTLDIADLIDDYTRWKDGTPDGACIVNGGDGTTDGTTGTDGTATARGSEIADASFTTFGGLDGEIDPGTMERMVDVMASNQRTNQYVGATGVLEGDQPENADLRLRLRKDDMVSFTLRVHMRATKSVEQTSANSGGSSTGTTQTASATAANGEGQVFSDLIRQKTFVYHTQSITGTPLAGAFDMRLVFKQSV